MGAGAGPLLLQSVALLLVAGAVAAAALAWRAARQARCAAEASAAQAQTLRQEVRRAIHDLNNPLAVVAINAELLRLSCQDNEQARRLAEGIQDQVERAKDALAALSNIGKPS